MNELAEIVSIDELRARRAMKSFEKASPEPKKAPEPGAITVAKENLKGVVIDQGAYALDVSIEFQSEPSKLDSEITVLSMSFAVPGGVKTFRLPIFRTYRRRENQAVLIVEVKTDDLEPASLTEIYALHDRRALIALSASID
ncbi:MAG: hypothetical protein WCJ29_01670 [bacterium]